MKKELINKLVNAMDLNKDNKVLIHVFGDEIVLDEVYSFMSEFLKIGVYPYIVLDSKHKLTTIAKSKTLFNDSYFDYMKDIDVIIDIMYYVGPKCEKGITKDEVNAINSYLQGFMKKAQDKKKFIQLRMPSIDQAQAASMEIDELESLLINAYDIDYKKMNYECNVLKDKLSINTKYQLISVDGSILNLDLDGRAWYIDAGDGDLPCGEIYIAPVEENTNGEVYFDKLFLDGNTYDSIKIVINHGRIVESTNVDFMKYIDSLPPNGDIICELGIGLNPNVKSLVGLEYLDEKAINTLHLGLGMNIMFGGKNEALSHLDLVGSFKLGVIK